MPKATKKQSIWILVAIIAGLAALAGWFWIWPSLQHIDSGINTIQNQKGEIKQLEQQRGLAVEDDIDRYDQVTQNLSDNLVTEENLIKLIEELETIAGESGAEYQLSVAGEDDKDNPAAQKAPDQKDPSQPEPEQDTVELKLRLTGNFPQLLGALKKIENMPTVVNVPDIKIDKSVTINEGVEEDSGPQITGTSVTADYTLIIPLSS